MVRWRRSQELLASRASDTSNNKGAMDAVKQEEEGEALEWDAMYGRLIAFKNAEGHCNADRATSDPALGQWVMSQRRHYIAFMASLSSTVPYATPCLNHSRVEKLLSLGLDLNGFVADTATDPTATTANATPERRKIKAPPATTGDEAEEEHVETRRPPKKRKKSVDLAQVDRQPRKVSLTETEERDAPTTHLGVSAFSQSDDLGERDDVSPTTERPIKGRGDSAWETLMNVTALMPKLPTIGPPVVDLADHHPPPLGGNAGVTTPVALVAASPNSSATGSPQTKRVKSKYGDLDALPNAGCSYSSKYRAANNDVVPNQQRWEDMFVRLVRFKDIHGHCRVPNRYPEDPSLGSWVATQRRYYKNKSLPMPEDRVQRLTNLGFEWTTKDPRKVPWETRFEGLKMFKERYGHVDVPHEWEECPQLGFWTANMRQQYRYKQLGKKSSLTDERVELLNEIGFVWKMQGGRRKKSDPVARPNQSSSPASTTEMAPVVSPPGSAQKRGTPLVLDPMSSLSSDTVRYGPPSALKTSPGPASTRSSPYYSNQVTI